MAQGNARGIVARRAISAALTGVLAFGGVMAPASAALAETAKVTLYGADGEATATNSAYTKAILLFKAGNIDNAANPEGALATGVTWNDTYTENVLGLLKGDSQTVSTQPTTNGASRTYLSFLQANGILTGTDAVATSYNDLSGDGKTIFEKAENVADYIGEEIVKANAAGASYHTDTTNPNTPNVTDSTSFAQKLAEALTADGTAGTDTFAITDGEVSLEETGYYVLTNDAQNAFPIWLPFNAADGDLKIFEKQEKPTIQKKVKETGTTGDAKKITDAGNGEVVTFELVGTLPTSVEAYTPVTFIDYLPAEGLTYKAGSLKVYYGESTEDKASEWSTPSISDYIDPSTGTLYKRFEISYTPNDGKFTANSDQVIKVAYEVTVTEDAGTGVNGLNTNKATFIYGPGQELTTESESSVASFEIELIKTDSLSGERLTGAKFTLKDVADDSNTKGKFVQEHGNMDDSAFEFEVAATDALNTDVNEQGRFVVKPVDASTYEVTETVAPTGKDPIDPFDLTITPVYDPVSGELTELEASVLGADGSATKAYVEANVADGVVTVTVPNGDQEVRLPITGMTPSQLGTFAGVLLVAAGAAMVLRRRQAEQA